MFPTCILSMNSSRSSLLTFSSKVSCFSGAGWSDEGLELFFSHPRARKAMSNRTHTETFRSVIICFTLRLSTIELHSSYGHNAKAHREPSSAIRWSCLLALSSFYESRFHIIQKLLVEFNACFRCSSKSSSDFALRIPSIEALALASSIRGCSECFIIIQRLTTSGSWLLIVQYRL